MRWARSAAWDSTAGFHHGEKALRELAHPEVKALLEAQRAERTRRILHEGKAVQHPEVPLPHIALAAEKIEKLTKAARGEVDGEGVDGEVAPIEIAPEGAAANGRKRARVLVALLARAGHVDVIGLPPAWKIRAAREKNARSAEHLVGPCAPAKIRRQAPRQRDAVPLDHDIDVVVRYAEQKIPHEPTHHEGRRSALRRQDTDRSEYLEYVTG